MKKIKLKLKTLNQATYRCMALGSVPYGQELWASEAFQNQDDKARSEYTLFTEQLEQYRILPHLTPFEFSMNFLATDPDEEDMDAISNSVESLGAILWAMNLVEKMPAPDQLFDWGHLYVLFMMDVFDMQDGKAVFDRLQPQYRSIPEIVRARDLCLGYYLRLNGLAVNSYRQDKRLLKLAERYLIPHLLDKMQDLELIFALRDGDLPIASILNGEVYLQPIFEGNWARLRAFDWLLGQCDDWDHYQPAMTGIEPIWLSELI